jgi:hypothetical protein
MNDDYQFFKILFVFHWLVVLFQRTGLSCKHFHETAGKMSERMVNIVKTSFHFPQKAIIEQKITIGETLLWYIDQ